MTNLFPAQIVSQKNTFSATRCEAQPCFFLTSYIVRTRSPEENLLNGWSNISIAGSPLPRIFTQRSKGWMISFWSRAVIARNRGPTSFSKGTGALTGAGLPSKQCCPFLEALQVIPALFGNFVANLVKRRYLTYTLTGRYVQAYHAHLVDTSSVWTQALSTDICVFIRGFRVTRTHQVLDWFRGTLRPTSRLNQNFYNLKTRQATDSVICCRSGKLRHSAASYPCLSLQSTGTLSAR